MRILAGLLTVAMVFPAAAAGELRFRFIGNEAFEITDGDQTLLTDFPYESGYSIYMDYPESEIHRRENSVCLITHTHRDHFEPSLVGAIGCKVVGPAGEVVELGNLTVRPVRTPHRDLEHYSYLVEWQGLRLFFVGDTEADEQVPDELDVLFVSPWLLSELEAAGRRPAREVVVYHHTADERVQCDGCRVPRQGETFVIRSEEKP